MNMSYEKLKAGKPYFDVSEKLPEFSAFLESIRISQIVQAKIREVNAGLKQVAAEPEEPAVTRKLTEIEKRMAELLDIRNKLLKKGK